MGGGDGSQLLGVPSDDCSAACARELAGAPVVSVKTASVSWPPRNNQMPQLRRRFARGSPRAIAERVRRAGGALRSDAGHNVEENPVLCEKTLCFNDHAGVERAALVAGASALALAQ